MKKNPTKQIKNLDPAKASAAGVTESGELERPALRRRKIDCGGNPEIHDRRNARGGGSRDADKSAAR